MAGNKSQRQEMMENNGEGEGNKGGGKEVLVPEGD